MLSKPDQILDRTRFLELGHSILPLRERIQEPLRSILFDNDDLHERNGAFFDVHAHSFSIDHIPRGFIKLLHWVSQQDKINLTELIYPTFGRYLKMKSPRKVLESLIATYDASFNADGITPELFIVNLTMDMERGISGGVQATYHEQLEELLAILKESTPPLHSGTSYPYRKTVLPFLAIDPNNPEVYNLFLSAFIQSYNTSGIELLDNDNPFVGIKLYPSLGYSPLDPVLLDIYSICEEKAIPITTHCGGIRTRTGYRTIEIGQRKTVNGAIIDSKKTIEVYSKDDVRATFLDPLHWEEVVRQFPKLKLNLAHFGSTDDWKAFHENPHDPTNFVFKTLRMMEEHENVYADISYSYFDARTRDFIGAMMQEERYRYKVLYGSDFYLSEVERIETAELVRLFKEKFTYDPEGYHLITNTNPYRFLFREP